MSKLHVWALGLLLMGACSTDDGQDEILDGPVNPNDPENLIGTPDGVYEGDWAMRLYGLIDTGRLTVSGSTMTFDLPAEAIVSRLGLVSETQKDVYPDEPFFTTSSDYQYDGATQEVQLIMQGYSENAYYMQPTGVSNAFSSGHFSIGLEADGVPYRIDLIGKNERSVALYFLSTGLWNISVPIDDIVIVNLQTGREITIEAHRAVEEPGQSAWRVVFYSKKKIA